MTIKNLALLFLSMTILFTSCSNDDDTVIPIIPLGDYENGILISHEGNFGQGNASVSYVSYDFTTVENGVYNAVNSNALGDTAQSITFYDDLAYIVLNVSNSIEIVKRYTFEAVGSITVGLNNPRYMTISNGKGYVSNWGDFTPSEDDYIAVIDLTSNTVIDTINSSYLPEQMITIGTNVYVATGVFGNGNQVDVINALTDELTQSITVGDSPNSMQLDSDGDLWVLSSDNLIEIDPNTNTVAQTLSFDGSVSFPSELNFDNGNLYIYASGAVYKMSETATTFPITPIINGLNFYGMATHNGVLYGVDAADFASNGTISAYNLATNTLMNSAELGIIPSGIYFN